MEYIKNAFAYIKRRKLLSVFLLCVLLVTVFFKSITDKIYIYLDDGYDRQSAQLIQMMDSVLGIPYSQKPFYRNDSVDIIKLSKEEWYTFPDPKADRNRERIKIAEGAHPLPIKDGFGNPLYATYKEPFYEDEIQDVLNPQKLVVPLPSVEEARHAESLKLSSIFYNIGLTKPAYRQLCDHFLTCKSLNVSIREEFLQNPTIVRNIIKIAERPCDYIRTIDEVKPEDEIIYSTRSYLGCKAFFPSKYKDRKEIALGIKLARERLDCNNNSFIIPSISHPSINNRKFVLLVFNKEGIVNKNNKKERSVNILVERKDIK